MVVFTCLHCGETLKKGVVAKHYQYSCRRPAKLTCVDCLKDFPGDEYEKHTKCLTEEERYSAKGFVAKPSSNKGERKQQAWFDSLQGLLETNLQKDERDLILLICKHENVPRKRKKFENFLANAYRPYAGRKDLVERVWLKMEGVFKEISNQEKGVGGTQGGSLNQGNVRTDEDRKRKTSEDGGSVQKQPKIEEEMVFKWRATILELLSGKNEIPLKKLQKRVLKRYMKVKNREVTEEIEQKCARKIQSIPNIAITEGIVRLNV